MVVQSLDFILFFRFCDPKVLNGIKAVAFQRQLWQPPSSSQDQDPLEVKDGAEEDEQADFTLDIPIKTEPL